MKPLLALTFMLLVAASTSFATTYVVRPDGTGDYPTIQEAIDACVNGDVVELTDGTFTGEGNSGFDYLGKAITVRSQTGNPETCAIEGYGYIMCHSGEGPSSVLEGITLHGISFGAMAPMGSPTIIGCVFRENYNSAVVTLFSPRISDCLFVDNHHTCWAWCEGTVTVRGGTIESCRFLRNSCNFSGGVVAYWGDVAISNCVFAETEAAGGHSDHNTALVVKSGSALVSGCTFVRNDGRSPNGNRPSGIHVRAGADATIDNCVVAFGLGSDCPAIVCEGSATLNCTDIYGNEGGDWVGYIENQYGINGNISEDPLFCDMASDDFTLDGASPCAPANSGSCGLIGALPVGCGATAVEPTTWGSIKASFR